MVQSPSWEANWFAASQEILRISRNPKVHYRTHKRPPPVSIQGQPNPVHIPTSHLLEFHPNIIHTSILRSPQWSPSLRFPQQDPIHPLFSPIRATFPAHLIQVHPNIIHPSTSRSPQWSPSLRFPHQDPIHPLFSPIRAHRGLKIQNSKFNRNIQLLFPPTEPQGGSNMTGTDMCVNLATSVPVIFEPPCKIIDLSEIDTVSVLALWKTPYTYRIIFGWGFPFWSSNTNRNLTIYLFTYYVIQV